jgi:ABC-2 type transport system permease protein
VVFSLVLAVLMAAVGVLVSLRASTVRQAYQTLSLSVLAIWLMAFLAFRYLPAGAKASLLAFLDTVNLSWVVALSLGALVVADVIFTRIAVARFQRARLILD